MLASGVLTVTLAFSITSLPFWASVILYLPELSIAPTADDASAVYVPTAVPLALTVTGNVASALAFVVYPSTLCSLPLYVLVALLAVNLTFL